MSDDKSKREKKDPGKGKGKDKCKGGDKKSGDKDISDENISGENMPDKNMQIEILHVPNRLRRLQGLHHTDLRTGQLMAERIAEADKVVAKMCEGCEEAIAENLQHLTRSWGEMRDLEQSQAREDLSQKVFTSAHEIKDIGSMCGYTLAADFAESLRDYIAKTELSMEAQRVIIQAHVDALTVVTRQGMKEEGGPAAEELKKMVKIAIDKYS